MKKSPDTNETNVPSISPSGQDTTVRLLQNFIESSPVATTVEFDLAQISDIPVPSLEGVSVIVPPTEGITHEEIMEVFGDLYYELATRTYREPGTPIQLGDELVLDLLGYVEGTLIPFSAREELVLRLEPDMLFKGFGTQLVGTPVGKTTTIKITLDRKYPIKELRRHQAIFVVQVHAAATISFPPPDSPEIIERFEMGETTDEILQNIELELQEERAQAMVRQGMELVMQQLVQRVELELPKKAIDEEIRFWWRNSEGRFLHEKDLERDDLEASLRAWQHDEEIRQDAEYRLKSSLVLRAIAQDAKLLDIDTDEIQGFVDSFAESMGISPEDWRQTLRESAEEREALVEKYITLNTLSYIMSKVHVQYGETDVEA